MEKDIIPSVSRAWAYWKGRDLDERLRTPELCTVCIRAYNDGAPGVRYKETDRFVCYECVEKIRAVVER